MDQRTALITLIQASILIRDEAKKDLMNAVPHMSDRDVKLMGSFLALERKLVLDHEDQLIPEMEKAFAMMAGAAETTE